MRAAARLPLYRCGGLNTTLPRWTLSIRCSRHRPKYRNRTDRIRFSPYTVSGIQHRSVTSVARKAPILNSSKLISGRAVASDIDAKTRTLLADLVQAAITPV